MKEAGCRVVDICRFLGLSRSTFYRKLSRLSDGKSGSRRLRETLLNAELIGKIKQLKKEHPFWGYRRVWAYLRYRMGYDINQKRVYRLMKQEGILCKQVKKLKAERKYKSKPRATRPRQYLGIDATKFWVTNLGWVNLIVLIDWYTKEILSHGVHIRNRSLEWQEVLLSGLEKGFSDSGVEFSDFNLVSDHGSQPTSRSFKNFCRKYEIKQIFATFDNPKGNADTERVIRTIKEEVIWINEFETIDSARRALKGFVDFYNHEYCHSSLNYKSPTEYFNEWMEAREKYAA